ncbi:MAG: hypothetical protein HN491_10925 [Rhodospirillales bacterium]|nr:hypothetical protein [Rhodospirillales bacterium]
MSIWHEILETHPDLTVVLVSTDKLEDSERIENLLERHQLTGVESWVFADPFVERLRYDVDPKWRGELPRTYFIDVSGKLHAHSGMVDPATLKSWLTASGVP